MASGRIDAFWSSSLKPWDVAAGVLLVQEAGGTVTGLQGDMIDIMIPSVIAACSEPVGRSLVAILS
ncbi:MAG: inositol monophosphatase family protein [Planctomycetaceae bacterium]